MHKMLENAYHNLALECRYLAQQLSEDNEELDTASRSRQSKKRKDALQALLHLADQRHNSLDSIRDYLLNVYQSSPAQSKARQQVAQMLLAWAKHRDIPFRDAVEAAHTLLRLSPKGSEEKQQAIQMLLTQACWSDITMKQSVEAVTALCYVSPLRSKGRDQGILKLLDLAQCPHLSVEDALVFITLDSDQIALIGTTSVLLQRRELALKKQMLEALAQRPDLTSEQAALITKALSVL